MYNPRKRIKLNRDNFMQHESISATELARNISTSVDKVRVSGKSIYITRGTQTVAELCPPPKTGYPVDQLAEMIASLPGLGKDAEVMSNDLKQVRQHAKLPGDPWV